MWAFRQKKSRSGAGTPLARLRRLTTTTKDYFIMLWLLWQEGEQKI